MLNDNGLAERLSIFGNMFLNPALGRRGVGLQEENRAVIVNCEVCHNVTILQQADRDVKKFFVLVLT